ncbi:MAG TPA: polyhydroxyalkanoic acid system family protein [Myxococcaceae bacterium]|nr:polyhydroxyalkanoic acid system family protein [Myxococcaceae bacterium]
MRHAPPLLLLSVVVGLSATAAAQGTSRSSTPLRETAALSASAEDPRLGRESARSLGAVGGLSAGAAPDRARPPLNAPGSGRPYTIRIEQPHTYSAQEARVRLSYLLDYWTERFGVTQQWSGNTVLVTGKVLGIRVEAWVQVQGHRIWALAVDPGPLMRGAGERYIRKKIAKYMHPTYEEL